MHRRVTPSQEGLYSSTQDRRTSTAHTLLWLPVLVLASLAISCSGNDKNAQDAHLEPDELPVAIIRSIVEAGPTTLPQLVDASSTIVRATLTSIDENYGLREGPNEDEPTAHYVELIGLRFTVNSTIAGDIHDEITIPWYGYIRENVDGHAGERSALIELEGVQFSSVDIGSSYVLFLEQSDDGSLDVINTISGLARVDETDTLLPLSVGGVFGREAESHTVTDIASYVQPRESIESGEISQ